MATHDGTMATVVLLKLVLIPFSDSLANSALGVHLDPSLSLTPGLWNIGITNVILSTLAGAPLSTAPNNKITLTQGVDLTGQPFLEYLADYRGTRIATIVKTSSVSLQAYF